MIAGLGCFRVPPSNQSFAGLPQTAGFPGQTSADRLARWFRGAVMIFAVLPGALGTTLLSNWFGQFIFTWPLCLFIAFRVIVDRAGSRPRRATTKRWGDRLLFCAFFAVCLGYYLLCRRLSLGAEWVFLSGFAVAAPLLVWSRNLRRKSWRASLGGVAVEIFAFAIYYWASVAILLLRYRS
jgi:hypothetical protein